MRKEDVLYKVIGDAIERAAVEGRDQSRAAQLAAKAFSDGLVAFVQLEPKDQIMSEVQPGHTLDCSIRGRGIICYCKG